MFLCDFLVFEWIKIKLYKDSLTLNDIWREMKYHKKNLNCLIPHAQFKPIVFASECNIPILLGDLGGQ